MASQALKDIIEEIGGYFGVRSADAYLAAILGEDRVYRIDRPSEPLLARPYR